MKEQKKNALIMVLNVAPIAGIGFLLLVGIETFIGYSTEVSLLARLFIIVNCPVTLCNLYLLDKKKNHRVKISAAISWTIIAFLFVAYQNPFMLLR